MDHARADILAARHRLQDAGWIPRDAEAFRHLPPPPAPVWLAAAPEAASTRSDARPQLAPRRPLHPLGPAPPGPLDARRTYATDPATREADVNDGAAGALTSRGFSLLQALLAHYRQPSPENA